MVEHRLVKLIQHLKVHCGFVPKLEALETLWLSERQDQFSLPLLPCHQDNMLLLNLTRSACVEINNMAQLSTVPTELQMSLLSLVCMVGLPENRSSTQCMNVTISTGFYESIRLLFTAHK